MTDIRERVILVWPYIILVICATYITCVCLLKFKYFYWYNQPLTFRWTIHRFFGSENAQNTRVMYSLQTTGTFGYQSIVYPFLKFVNHDEVQIYGGKNRPMEISDAPYERIAAFLSKRDSEIVEPGRRVCIPGDTVHIPGDMLRYIFSQESHGLSVFVGILSGCCGGDTYISTPIKGVCILSPRILLSFTKLQSPSANLSQTIYVCDHLAWLRYTTRDRDSLALIETTEYIQKSRENSGEQTLYKYREIPWFVVPFTTVYSYTFATSVPGGLPGGLSVAPVSSTNFALFYSFVNEHVRDFRYCILHEISELQSLIQGGIYRMFMLLLNQVRVLAVYIFAPSWMKVSATKTNYQHFSQKPRRTRGNRISELHKYIAETSTALVKYLPPVEHPKYDIFGKRVKTDERGRQREERASETKESLDIALLKSSIRDKSICDNETFLRGFHMSLATFHPAFVCIDTIAHNYLLIDTILASTTLSMSWKLTSREKWYYILYNAIIKRETSCKDIFIA